MHRYKSSPGPRGRPALDAARLEALALRYVGRYATTRAKLAAYLERKLRAGEWTGEGEPPVATLVEKLAELGYVDDRAFAEARAGSLSRRGFGPRRVSDALRAAGVSEEDGADAHDAAHNGALRAALALARRRGLGPYADPDRDVEAEQRAIAILVRAGHDFSLARRVARARHEQDLDA